MSLKEQTTRTIYSSFRRFLENNVGGNWDKLFSEVCDAAPASTEVGRRLRQMVPHYVDVHGIDTTSRWKTDYYVEDGILKRYPSEKTWKKREQEKINKAPIERIVTGNPSVWFELTETIDGRPGSKYSETKKYWFRYESQVVKDTMPNQTWSQELKRYINDGTFKEFTKEIIHKRQCNRREVIQLENVAKRRRKIFRLTWFKKTDKVTFESRYILQAEIRP